MSEGIKKPGGRPTKRAAEALDAKLIEVAHRSFVEHGFNGTSMTAVAAEARVGKQTLYRRYQSKAELLRAVVYYRIKTASALPDIAIDAQDPLGELREIARTTMDVIMDADFITLHRVLISEARDFPELVAYAGRWGSMHIDRSVDAIARAMKIGLLPPGDATMIATSFLWGVIGDALYRTLMGEMPAEVATDRERYFNAKWEASGLARIRRMAPV